MAGDGAIPNSQVMYKVFYRVLYAAVLPKMGIRISLRFKTCLSKAVLGSSLAK